MKKLARIISDIFVPPTFTLIAFIILAFQFETEEYLKLWVALSGAVFGFVLPVIFFIYLRKKGRVVNNDATVKEERTFPYFIGVVLCLTAFALLYFIGSNSVAYSLWLAYAVNTILLILINKFWKISAHAIGSATFVGLVYFLYGFSGLYFIILLVLIGVSRLILKVHTPMQIIMGSLFGFFLTYWQLVFFTSRIFNE